MNKLIILCCLLFSVAESQTNPFLPAITVEKNLEIVPDSSATSTSTISWFRKTPLLREITQVQKHLNDLISEQMITIKENFSITHLMS